MKNIFKQFGEWVTLSSRSEYSRAVLVLAVKYTIGVLIILTIFNFLVYGLFANNIDTKNEERFEQTEFNEYGNELESGLINILLISDGIILVFTFIAGYQLSKRTLAPLEENYKMQSRFIADAAHELRTPMAVMQAGSEVILRNDRSGDEYKHFIQESLEEVKRLTTLSNNLLFLASSQLKKDSLKSKVSISDICQKQIEIMQNYADARNVSINGAITEGLMVVGIKDDLIRLIMNLLKNAIDYNQSNGTVTVTLKKIKNQIVLTVADTGLGIKSEDLPHIFERFYKADSSRQTNSSGTGLGLAIVKGIVNEHHGLIKVSSVLGKGSSFEVILTAA